MLKKYREIVLKPSNSRGGRNVFVISKKTKGFKTFNDRREIVTDLKNFKNKFKKNLDKNYPLILMNKLKEPVYDLDMLAWKGRPLRVIPRKRFNSAVPNDGHIIVNDQKLINLGKKIISQFKLSWLYDCDIMYDKNKVPQILEINPRPSGSIVVSICAGIPLLRDLMYLKKGLKINNIKLPLNKRIVPYKSLSQIN
jgi:carbamoyl-phosphate synthase large subunit